MNGHIIGLIHLTNKVDYIFVYKTSLVLLYFQMVLLPVVLKYINFYKYM